MQSPFPEGIRNLGIVSLAGIPNADSHERGIARLKEWGVVPVEPDVMSKPKRFFAAPDKDRIAQLEKVLLDPEVDAVMAARGGYGCARLLDDIDWELMRSRNLPFIGYSDVTAFHLAALKHGCRNHIHGPMLTSEIAKRTETPEALEAMEKTLDSLRAVLTQENDLITFGKEDVRILKAGRAEAPLVPANLTVLCSLLGTPHFPNLTGTILAVEDVNEAAYRIDRCLNQLRQAGVLPRLKGLVFGAFTDTEDGEYLEEILQEYADQIRGPVIAGVPFGHRMPTLSLPVGSHVVLDAPQGGGATLTLSKLAAYTPQIFTDDDFTLGYQMMEPRTVKKGEKVPLLLFLHGAGERGCDNALQLVNVLPYFAEESFQKDYPCFIVAPQCPENEQWVHVPWGAMSHEQPEKMSRPLEAVWHLVNELLEDYPIDPTRIYVMGISMGGYGTWDLATRYPEFFAAAVPICGGADETKAGKIAQLPIWAFHGAQDNVVPPERSRNMVAALKKIGGNVQFTEYPELAHGCWEAAVRQPGLMDWLFQQHK